jgi:hypothetical protein
MNGLYFLHALTKTKKIGAVMRTTGVLLAERRG